MKAILGSWGIGGYLKGKGQDGEIKGGFFDKQRFLTSKQIRKRIHDDPYQIFLPPITKFSNGGIDYLPFILYDKVIMDSGCFETICYKSEIIPPKIREFIGSDVSGILEKLRENEILELKDYRQILDSDEADRDIDENVKWDLQDSNIIEPVANSLENWKEFYQTLLDSCNPHDNASIES